MVAGPPLGPSPVNIPIQTIDEIINDVIKTIGLATAFTALTNAVPFLGWPIINIFVGWFINKVGNAIIAALQKFVDFKIIDWETISENKAYQSAVVDLKVAQTSGDQNAINAASISFKKTLANLVHFDGA